MSATTTTKNAERQGRLWGTDPVAWSEVEEAQRPTYEAALDRLPVGPGTEVLDIGCGAGTFLALAAERDAVPSGIDSSMPLLERARSRVPTADLRSGAIERLPYDDDGFDVVTGFNSFFFAADMTEALREARRVAKPGGTVLVQVWGPPEACDLGAMLAALASLRTESGGRGPELWRTSVLEGLCREAGLAPRSSFAVAYPFHYADEGELLRRMAAAGGVAEAIAGHGRETVERRILDALEPYRAADGSYVLENEWRFLESRA